jgi:hypothetical protein
VTGRKKWKDLVRQAKAHRGCSARGRKNTFVKVKVKVKVTLEQATKARKGSRGTALLFL